MRYEALARWQFWRAIIGILAGTTFAVTNFLSEMGTAAYAAFAVFLGMLLWAFIEWLLMRGGSVLVVCPECKSQVNLVPLRSAQDSALRLGLYQSFGWPMQCGSCHVTLHARIWGRVFRQPS
jgi:hypothetical protein